MVTDGLDQTRVTDLVSGQPAQSRACGRRHLTRAGPNTTRMHGCNTGVGRANGNGGGGGVRPVPRSALPSMVRRSETAVVDGGLTIKF